MADFDIEQVADHPHTDPGDGRQQCDMCCKFVWPGTHSCKGVPVAQYDRAAKHFHPYPDDPEVAEFTDDEWLMLMRNLASPYPVGIARHYVGVMRRREEATDA